jgi:carboxypeptidase Q
MKHLSSKLFFTALMFAGVNAMAQTEPVDTAVFSKIRKAELSNSHIPSIAHYITDVSGPRLTNSPGYKRAGMWAIETMKKWGLVNTAMEPWGNFGKSWEIEDFSISLKEPYSQSLTAYPEPWSGNTKGEIHSEVVVYPGNKTMDTTYLIKHMSELKGKIVLVVGKAPSYDADFKPSAERYTQGELDTMKDTYMLSRKVMEGYLTYFKTINRIGELFQKSGALAMLTAAADNVNGTVFVQGFSGYKTNTTESMPRAAIASEDGQRLKRLIESGQKVEVNLNIKAKFSEADIKGYNVVGEIPGTDPKLKSQLVMLGGHMDAWASSTGATDNGAGCIVMLEAVRLLDSLGLKPKRTIRIALWGGEEQGLLGSYGYAKNHFRGTDLALKPEAAKVSAYFNLDNGTGKIRGIFAQGNTAIKPIFEQWFKPFTDLGATNVTLSSTGSTDHLSFDWAGIPGFQFIQDPIDYETRTHHSNQDNYDHLKIEDLKQAAIIVASFVYQTSVRPEMMPRKALEKETFVFDGL